MEKNISFPDEVDESVSADNDIGKLIVLNRNTVQTVTQHGAKAKEEFDKALETTRQFVMEATHKFANEYLTDENVKMVVDAAEGTVKMSGDWIVDQTASLQRSMLEITEELEKDPEYAEALQKAREIGSIANARINEARSSAAKWWESMMEPLLQDNARKPLDEEDLSFSN